MDLKEKLTGEFYIQFSPSNIAVRVTIVDFVVNTNMIPIFLVGQDESIYNWINIVSMRKVD